MVSVESQCRRLTKTFQHLDEKHDYMLDKRAFSQFRPFQSGDDESLYIHGDRRRSTSPGDDLNQQTDIKFEQKLLITDKSTSKISLVCQYFSCHMISYHIISYVIMIISILIYFMAKIESIIFISCSFYTGYVSLFS